MKHSMLTRLVIGAALTAAVASVNCGGDDSNPPAGTGGAAGSGGSAVTGGSAGTGGAGTGGTAGTGGSATGGAAGTGGARDGGTGGVRADGGDAEAAAAATFGQVAQILQDHCISCHGGTPDGGPGVNGILDLRNQADDGGQS